MVPGTASRVKKVSLALSRVSCLVNFSTRMVLVHVCSWLVPHYTVWGAWVLWRSTASAYT
jgi:hypothetical protein